MQQIKTTITLDDSTRKIIDELPRTFNFSKFVREQLIEHKATIQKGLETNQK